MGGRGAYYGRSFYVMPSGHTKKEKPKATISAEEVKQEFQGYVKSGLDAYKKAADEAGFYVTGNENDKKYSLSDVDFNYPQKLKKQESEAESIKAIAGPDLTDGSCASAALSFIMRRAGYDVTDFRGGQSRDVFSRGEVMLGITGMGDTKRVFKGNRFAATHQLLKEMEPNKRYLLTTGRHAAIIKKENDYYYFLELQDTEGHNGWKPLGGTKRASDVDLQLGIRFAAKKSRYPGFSTLTSIESLTKNENLTHLASFFNTKGMKQMKGVGGHAK